MIIVLLGAPGAGKGTQAKRLAAKRGFRHVSTGDLLRDAVARDTELGREAEGYMKSGRLVPDEVVLGLVEELFDADGRGADIILDGFPRTVPQAEGLDTLLERQGAAVDCVVFIDITVEEAVRRLSSRVSCASCGAVYNLLWKPPATDGVCDACGGELTRRSDDEPEAIERRFKEYHVATEPLTDYYRSRGILREVDTTRTSEEIQSEIDGILDGGCGARETG
ncbi:adenylate kinase [bacterium]|nr:adenylate kinase [bacterium]